MKKKAKQEFDNRCGCVKADGTRCRVRKASGSPYCGFHRQGRGVRYVKTSFRLKESTLLQLEEYAVAKQLSKTKALERLITDGVRRGDES